MLSAFITGETPLCGSDERSSYITEETPLCGNDDDDRNDDNDDDAVADKAYDDNE